MMDDEAFEFVEEFGGISSYTHRGNGLQVLLCPDKTVPVTAFMVTYRVGSRNEGAGTTGATHLLEHLMFKGSKRFNKASGTDVFDVLQEVGARVNASTWFDRTNYYEVLPAEHLELAVEVEADRMRDALISDDDLASERVVVLNELDRGRNSAVRNLYHAVWSTAFHAHPYRHPTIGWRSDVEHMSAADLKTYYNTYYWPDNATVSVIGHIDVKQTLGLIDQYFGIIPRSTAPIGDVRTTEPEQMGPRHVVVKQAGQLGAVIHGFKVPPAVHDDSDALDVLARIISGGMNSRGYRMMTDRGLTTSVGCDPSRLRNPGLFCIWAMMADDATHTAVDEAITALILAIQEEGVTDEEVTRAQSKIEAESAFGRDGPFSMASQLNEAIAAGDWKLYATYSDRIKQTTAEDVRRVARTYLNEDTRTVGHYIPDVAAGNEEAL